MRTLILCGGKGTRAFPHTVDVPKPLLEIAGRPVLVHLMEIYAAQGFTDFVLAGGYKLEMIERFTDDLPTRWNVEVFDTGVDTNTGGRVRRCLPELSPTFFVTYADGLGDVDLHALAAFHRRQGGLATLTTVPLPSQYGTLELDPDGRVVEFNEKPILQDHLINAGFFVFEQAALDAPGEDLERDVLPSLGRAGQLFAYRHERFWKSMDTYKDALDLTALCERGGAPWEWRTASKGEERR